MSGVAVWCLGMTQLISWGVTYYLIGVFGYAIAGETGWSFEIVFGGFSLALLVMGLSSPPIGAWIDRSGGRPAMAIGAVANAAGCLIMARTTGVPAYFAAWTLLGLGMRLSLYDAAFATLARLLGSAARRPMSQITLLGGLASTAFWPVGNWLIGLLGWRDALVAYAAFALLPLPLLAALPAPGERDAPVTAVSDKVREAGQLTRAAILYALIVTLANFLNSGMSAHMVTIMLGLGLGSASAILASGFRGIGQSGARLCEVLFGGRLNPLALNLFATMVLPISFVIGLWSGSSWLVAVAFAGAYGAGNGLLTITRGTVPLILFDPASYGRVVGRLIAPSFFLSATAPIVYAAVMSHFGDAAALVLSAAVSAIATIAAVALWAGRRAGSEDRP